MVILEPNLLECEICKSIIRREQIDGVCETCGKRTCTHCQRVCERCRQIFCMYHVETREVWSEGIMSRVLLCERCRTIWNAKL